MNNKLLIGIIISVIIIAVIGFIGYGELNNNENKITVGDASFILPNGYSKGDLVEPGIVNITNGSNSLSIKENSGSNIQTYIDRYIKYNKDRNYTTKVYELNIGGFDVHKSKIVGNNKTFHYWFLNNDKVYEISTFDGNNQTDYVVLDLIKSLK